MVIENRTSMNLSDLNESYRCRLFGCTRKKKVGSQAQAGRTRRPPPSPSRTSRWQHRSPSPSPRTSTMHLSRFGLLALGATAVDAFRDTSPFFLASTSEYVRWIDSSKLLAPANHTSPRVLMNSAYIKTGASLLDNLSSSLSTCPSDYYVVVHQPGVHSSDFEARKSAPRLGAKMLGKDKSIRSKMSVNEVAGLLEAKDIQAILENKCKVQTTVIDGSCELLCWPLP